VFPVCSFDLFFVCFTTGTFLKLLCKNFHEPGLNLKDFNDGFWAQDATTPAFREVNLF